MAPSATINASPSHSALTTFIHTSTPPSASLTHPLHYHHLASQVLHNLRYQHDWTSLQIHTHSPLSAHSETLLPRPLISGLPPHRIYIHPDEQIELLKKGAEGGKEDEEKREREWVLPTHLKEKWCLRRFAEVFDAVGETPPDGEQDENGREGAAVEKRRGGKRVLLATVSDDSTVVYYIVHDGIVKPRQN
ncbi:MAG: hypothetical protein Q9187_002447 [Circinaria calcarea]